jgi:hypothetical protein
MRNYNIYAWQFGAVVTRSAKITTVVIPEHFKEIGLIKTLAIRVVNYMHIHC